MASKKSGILFFFFWICGISLQAQSISADPFRDADGNTFHQLFLDFKVVSISEISYTTGTEAVDAELSTDGFSVIIKNYPGDRSVRLKVVDGGGNEKEITKGRCFIDPVLIQL